ncbi:MAG: N-acetyltransferase [Nevskiaceae bacterium]|nr:MAG: N-acetyltransferase [Nevskiaceae bacterium]TAM26039.1 MAG: N-acetyltransferase [Nevskiaceae bacterium]
MLTPVTLEGRHVRLEPLLPGHHAALCEAGSDPATFRWFPSAVAGEVGMRDYIESGLTDLAAGRALPFVIRHRADERIVGATRFAAFESVHRRAEIGWTWLQASACRTPVNTECKRLLLAHGFERLDLNRIEFKTDSRNAASRAALARIGATEEGTFRNHMLMPDGSIRHSVWFSILREEWPRVRTHLDALLAQTSNLAAPAQV